MLSTPTESCCVEGIKDQDTSSKQQTCHCWKEKKKPLRRFHLTAKQNIMANTEVFLVMNVLKKRGY